MHATTVHRNAYQSPTFAVDAVFLAIDLFEEDALVRSRLAIRRLADGPVRLDGEHLELLEIRCDGKEPAADTWQLEDGNLVLFLPAEQFELETLVRIKPPENRALSGLYASNGIFCTQCEAEGFRRITFYPDRPDVLSVFTTRISAPESACPVLLSNGNCIGSGKLENGRHWAEWHDPFPKPSYLFALVAGSLDCLEDHFETVSGRKVGLKVYVEKGELESAHHAMASLKAAMRWDEVHFGREYDLDIYMIVAVSDFNMGAMENKGLNIFNAKYILARPETATDGDFANIENVVAHEYFHNWTGNRVTCRDWFQLSLKEGLTVFRDQEFSRDMHSRDVCRIEDVRILRNAQFPEDAGSMAHPVRPESYEEINNFYTATVYNKGAEVIRMQHTLLGETGFRRGMDLYFARHDGQAVTIEDFVKAMEDANGVDFTQLRRWYSQAGTPKVRASTTFDQGRLTLTLEQGCDPTPDGSPKAPFHIPVAIALFDTHGHAIPVPNPVLSLCEPLQTWVYEGLEAEPTVSLLRGFSAPVQLIREMEASDWHALLQCETDGFAKWEASRQLALHAMELLAQGKAGALPEGYVEVLREVLEDASLERDLRAEILTPPGFDEVVARLGKVDPLQAEAVRIRYREAVGQGLFAHAEALFERLEAEEDHAMHPKAFGRRKLRNVCLWLMMKSDEARALSRCITQFENAGTMTDTMASLSLLASCKDIAARDAALQAFLEKWSANSLVLDKWFMVQAMSECPDTLARVKALLNHPAYSATNPNKVRSLTGAFCEGNPQHFHAHDSSGYALLHDQLLVTDALNPQVAARLATPFTRFARYDAKTARRMHETLESLARHTLSRDLGEVVHKTLKAFG